MGVYADPSGVTLKFYDKEGKKLLRSVEGQGKLYAKARAVRRQEPDPAVADYSLGSPDWLTDIMVADTDNELKTMTPSDDRPGAALTSTCSKMVCVQWKESSNLSRQNNCVTLAIVEPGTEESDGRISTKEICIFPKGTDIGPDHPFWKYWHKTIDYLEQLHRPIDSRD